MATPSDIIGRWLAMSGWRDVRDFQYGGQFHSEARIYPDLNERREQVATGEGRTLESARFALAYKLDAMMAAEIIAGYPRGVCAACGEPIEYVGPYWRHVGPLQPRHIATPKQEG